MQQRDVAASIAATSIIQVIHLTAFHANLGTGSDGWFFDSSITLIEFSIVHGSRDGQRTTYRWGEPIERAAPVVLWGYISSSQIRMRKAVGIYDLQLSAAVSVDYHRRRSATERHTDKRHIVNAAVADDTFLIKGVGRCCSIVCAAAGGSRDGEFVLSGLAANAGSHCFRTGSLQARGICIIKSTKDSALVTVGDS